MKRKSQFERSLFQTWTVLLFVLVIAGFSFVQAAHMHGGATERPDPVASHCSLCLAVHGAAVVSEVGSAPEPTFHSTILLLSEPQFELRLRVATSFIRPPPQSL